MSWQNTIGHQQDYLYLRDSALPTVLEKHGNVISTKEKKITDKPSAYDRWQTIYKMSDGVDIVFEFTDRNKNGKLDNGDSDSVEIHCNQSEGDVTQTIEYYFTGDTVGDCHVTHMEQAFNPALKEGHEKNNLEETEGVEIIETEEEDPFKTIDICVKS